MIYNKTSKKHIAKEHKMCKNILCRAKGLMFSRRNEGRALVFDMNPNVRLSLHMWFVFYPIDVVFVDDKMKVVELKENFKPFSVYSPKSRHRFVIEIPTGAIRNSGTKLRDLVRFI